MGENTTIELEPTQCALIMNDDFTFEIAIPGDDDDDDIPMSVRYLTMLAILTIDENFVEEILEKFSKIAEDIMEEEEDKED